MGTVTKSRKSVKAVHGIVKLLQPFDANRAAGISINGTVYGLFELIDLSDEPEGNGVLGYRLVKGDGTSYDLPSDLSSCDCPDHTFQPERPGGCKHRAALGALRRAGKLS